MSEKNEASGGRSTNPWLVALTVSMATFMEVMDISIANVALRHIAGSVGADESESTWVLTSYLVSNAIVLPVSGWLSSVMGRKRFYMTCVAVFTISSFLCGIAPSLGLLLVFRVMQGAGGGGLAPSEQAILTDTFPASQRGLAFALYGVAVVVAPAIGPALGGWITDHWSWRWIFFINIPIGILSFIMTSILVQDSPAATSEHEKAVKGGIKVDYPGLALVALGFGGLQIVLDKGQEDDWFSSPLIVTFMILSAIGIIGMILWEGFGAKRPMVDLSLYRDRSFLFTNFMMFAVMFILLGTTQLLPQLVQQLLPYDATNAGLILMPGGFTIMALMPLVGFLVKKVQPKFLITFGFLCTSLGMYSLMNLDASVSFSSLAERRMLQAMGFAFLFVPIQTLAYSDLPKGKSNSASALINVMRNLGGSVGIAVGTTLMARRSQVQQARLVTHLTDTSQPFQQHFHALVQRFSTFGTTEVAATRKALGVVTREVQTQAAMLSYIDVFQLMFLGCFVAAAISLFLKKVDLGKAEAGG